MSNHTDSVRSVEDYLRGLAAKNNGRPELVDRLNSLANQLNAAAEHMAELEVLTKSLPPELGNIHDLPSELLDELAIAKTDELEDQIITVMNAYGGQASLDQILVGLYRKFKVIQKRRFLQNKLYRMANVFSARGRKGVYTLTEPKEGEQNESSDPADHDFKLDEDDSAIPF